jgi:hypothetical protein
MILQMHFQKIGQADKSEFVAQSDDIQNDESLESWRNGVMERHPLPDGMTWMICDETSDLFMRAATC